MASTKNGNGNGNGHKAPPPDEDQEFFELEGEAEIDPELQAIYEQAINEAIAEEEEEARNRPPPMTLQAWEKKATAFRVAHGLDFRKPVDFSRYLLLVYGKDADPEYGDQFFHHDFWDIELPGEWSTSYPLRMQAWQRALTPHGMQVSRGLSNVSYRSAEELMREILRFRDRDQYQQIESNYSMNAVVGAWDFSSRWLLHPTLTISPELAQAIVRRDPSLSVAQLTKRRVNLDSDIDAGKGEIEFIKGKRKGHVIGRPGERPKLDRSTMQRLRKALSAIRQSVTLVATMKNEDMLSFGGDSESGDTEEAEIKVRHCEPQCLNHAFVASQTAMGKPVSAEMARYHALSHHIEVEGKGGKDWAHPPTLRLHPDTPIGNQPHKIVEHLPPGYRWYDATRGLGS